MGNGEWGIGHGAWGSQCALTGFRLEATGVMGHRAWGMGEPVRPYGFPGLKQLASWGMGLRSKFGFIPIAHCPLPIAQRLIFAISGLIFSSRSSS
ncbi:hypothetical protein [Tolypothrix sp. VBCCA 56010]|uniref:hypothetical protein n=1 Tax=Tolypothrix sp. VBCCA 56010 TaxID=3137731 RepID=UPI003D7E10DC